MARCSAVGISVGKRERCATIKEVLGLKHNSAIVDARVGSKRHDPSLSVDVVPCDFLDVGVGSP